MWAVYQDAYSVVKVTTWNFRKITIQITQKNSITFYVDWKITLSKIAIFTWYSEIFGVWIYASIYRWILIQNQAIIQDKRVTNVSNGVLQWSLFKSHYDIFDMLMERSSKNPDLSTYMYTSFRRNIPKLLSSRGIFSEHSMRFLYEELRFSTENLHQEIKKSILEKAKVQTIFLVSFTSL